MKFDPNAFLVYEDESEVWLREIFENHREEARKRALSLVEEGLRTETGCIVTPTATPRKVIFLGRQVPAYRFVHCVLEGVVARRDQVVRQPLP